MNDQTTTLSHVRELMRQFVAERQWEKYHTPKNLAASASVEAGELLELFQWLTPQEAQERSMNDPAFRKAVGEELCDVLMYLVSLANAMDLDIAQALEQKLAKNRSKYPADKFQGHYERPLPE